MMIKVTFVNANNELKKAYRLVVGDEYMNNKIVKVEEI